MDSLLSLIYRVLPILFALVFPLTVFVVCDYNRRRTLAGVPNVKSTATLKNLHPAEIAALYSDGHFRTEFFWPEIVGLAIKKTLSIEKSGHTLVLMPQGFYRIEYLFTVATRITDADFRKLDPLNQKIMAIIFPFEKKTNLFSNREYLAAKIPEFGEAVRLSLFRKGLISPEAAALRSIFLASGAVLLAMGILIIDLGFIWRLSLAVSGFIALLFASMTRDNTPAGDEMIKKIKKMRREIERFEKGKLGAKKRFEAFEKLLPAAMALGMARTLDDRALKAFGTDFFSDRRPSWYSGYKDEKGFYGSRLYSQLASTLNFRGVQVGIVYSDQKR